LKDLKELISIIREARSFLLLPHVHADGDALGSCFGLKLYLESLGKTAYVLAEEPVEPKLEFVTEKAGCDVLLPGSELLPDPRTIDLALAVDVATPERLGLRGSAYKAAAANARIDHHDSGAEFSRYTLLDPTWAAAAEGVYLLIHEMGFDPDVRETAQISESEQKVAAALYTALVTDTGCFGYSNVTAQTHYIASRLRALAGDMSYVYHLVYEVQPRAYVRLMKRVLDKMQLTEDGIAWVALTREDFEAAEADDNDAEGIANFLRSVEGVHAGVFIKPDKYPGRFRVSMRSDELVNVSKVAAKYSGGGHACAAGCMLTGRSEADFQRELNELLADLSDAITWELAKKEETAAETDSANDGSGNAAGEFEGWNGNNGSAFGSSLAAALAEALKNGKVGQ